MKRAATALLTCTIVARAAQAQDAGPPQALRQTRWYGGQVMLVDAVSAGLIYAGVKTGSVVLFSLGVATVVTVPPLIHLAHGSRRDAALSFAFRVVPIGVGLGIYSAIAGNPRDCPEDEAAIVCAIFPFMVGAALESVAILADWTFLSAGTSGPRLTLAPVVPMGHRRGQGLALALRF